MEIRQRRLRDELGNNIEVPSETNDFEERQALVACVDVDRWGAADGRETLFRVDGVNGARHAA